jgi:hypothetical protein
MEPTLAYDQPAAGKALQDFSQIPKRNLRCFANSNSRIGFAMMVSQKNYGAQGVFGSLRKHGI